jgi:hypothetical protein
MGSCCLYENNEKIVLKKNPVYESIRDFLVIVVEVNSYSTPQYYLYSFLCNLDF